MASAPSDPTESGPFHFCRFGRAYHLRIESAADLARILELDEAHWVATSAPIETINADAGFLKGLDATQDGRIRARELKQAVQWLFAHLKDRAEIRPGNLTLDLDNIAIEMESGARIHRAAEKILRRNNSGPSGRITIETVRRTKHAVESGGMDRPGMVLPEAVPDVSSRRLVEDILAATGGDPHPSGVPGVTLDRLDEFLGQARAYLDWLAQAEAAQEGATSPIMPLGNETEEAYAVFSRLRPKLDQYFALCDLAGLDPDFPEKLRSISADLTNLDWSDAEALDEFLEKAPLAIPRTDGRLEFAELRNPRYTRDLDRFRSMAPHPILEASADGFGREEWEQVKKLFGPHQSWREAKPEVQVAPLGKLRLEEHLADKAATETIRSLIQESYHVAFDLDNIRLLEKLILFQGYMIPFANSFVSFPDLYDPEGRAMFEMGTLIMDGRHFTLSTKVLNRAQHVQFSEASNMFVLYIEVSDKEGEKLFEAAVPVTSGNRGNLQANKWGVFHDSRGRERHAQVVQIVENPISLAEAVTAPFRRLGAAITKRFGEKATEAETRLQSVGTESLTRLPPLPERGPPPARADPRIAGGILAGGGVAISALSISLAYITRTLADIGTVRMLAAFIGIAAAVMLPVTIVALIKLARRDLSAILEGSGWGINARMRLTRHQARAFTYTPRHPAGATGVRPGPWRLWWVLLALAAVGGLALFAHFLWPEFFPAPTHSPALDPG